MRKFLDGVYKGSLAAAGLFVVGIFVLMIVESVLRKLGGYVPGASDFIGWFCAAAGFLALPATFKRGDMVRVGILLDALPPALRKIVLLACLALGLIFVGYMIYAVASYLLEGWRYDEMTQGMVQVAVWIPQSSFLIGAALLMVAMVDETVCVLRVPAHAPRADKYNAAESRGAH